MNNEFRPGVWFQGGLDVATTVDLAVQAERAGVDAIWLAEGPIARDAFITLAAVAGATTQVRLATGVVNPFTRHPAQLAATFATLDELSGGRMSVGVGFGARDFLEPLGVDVSKPLATVREMVTIIRGLLHRDAVTLHSERFNLTDLRLGMKPLRQDMPLYLAATGPKMCELAGEVADGIYLLYGAASYIERSLSLSAERRPVDAKAFNVASPMLMAVTSDDEPRALFGVKVGIGLMLTEPNGEGMLEANNLDPAIVQPIRDGLRSGGIKGLAAAVDQSIIDRLTICGTVNSCVERLLEAASWGINEPQVLLSGDDPRAIFEVLAEARKVLG